MDGKDDEVEMTDDEDEVRMTAEDDENENNTYLNWEVSKLDDDDPNMTIGKQTSAKMCKNFLRFIQNFEAFAFFNTLIKRFYFPNICFNFV